MISNEIKDLAYEFGYEYIETTSERNGYPSNLKPAIVGSESFEEAEAFADANNLELNLFHRKHGWQLWVRDNHVAYHPINVRALYEGSCNVETYDVSDCEDYYDDHVRGALNAFDCIDAVEEFLKDQCEIMDELSIIDESEFILVTDGKYVNTLQCYAMSAEYDTTEYVIGAIAKEY